MLRIKSLQMVMLLIMTLAISLGLLVPSSAFADRWYSYAWSPEGSYTGVWGYWQNQDFWITYYENYQHIDALIWARTSLDSPETVEIGIRNE